MKKKLVDSKACKIFNSKLSTINNVDEILKYESNIYGYNIATITELKRITLNRLNELKRA